MLENIVFLISWVWQNWFGFLGKYMALKKVHKSWENLVDENLESMGSRFLDTFKNQEKAKWKSRSRPS
jgi:hypothetical protein